MENAVDVEQDAVGLLQGAAGRHDVIEDEGAFVHFRQEVGAESLVGEVCAQQKEQTGSGKPPGSLQSGAEDALVEAEDGRHEAAVVF